MKIVESQSELQLELPGVKLEQNQLTILRELTPDETRRTISALHAMDDSMRFWVGDFLVHVSQAHETLATPGLGEAAAREAAQNFTDPMGVWEAFRVCETLGAARRKLSYAHHREALAECGSNAQEALRWLRKAEEGQWSVKDLRRAIRLDRGLYKGEADRGTPTLCGAVNKLHIQISDVLKLKPVDELKLEEVSELLDELRPVEEVLQKLRQRWAYFNPELVG
jgi:hypothetical protein